jgi:outer membrane lipoprotein-sorting protein
MSTLALPRTLVFALLFLAVGASALADPESARSPATKPTAKASAAPAAKPAAKLAPISTPAAPPALPALSAAQIVDKNVAARGGLAAWQAVQTMSWKGIMGAGGTTYMTVTAKGRLQQKEREEMQLPFRLEFKRPLKSRLELDFNGQAAVQVYDGVNGWKLRPYLGRDNWDAYTPDELKQAAAEPGIDGFLIDYAARGAKVEAAGTDTVEGHAAYKLKVTRKDGQVRHVWVDGQSFLDIKLDGEPRKLDGRMRAVSVYLRDFKRDQGLMISHLQETVVQGVPKTEKVTIESVRVNPSLDDARFTKAK